MPTSDNIKTYEKEGGMAILDLQESFARTLAIFAAIYVLCIVSALLAFRLYVVLPNRVTNARVTPPSVTEQHVRTTPAALLVVLGSGGHTKEMLTMLQVLEPLRYRPLVFVRAESDARSEGMVKAALPPPSELPSSSVSFSKPDYVLTVPRSRSVGQSWLTTPLTTLRALAASVALVARLQPDVILCNGPGTCIPICAAGYILRFLGVKHVKIIFVESFCRVTTLSLTGKLLYWAADRFLVQWPGLRDKYPQAEYLGQLC